MSREKEQLTQWRVGSKGQAYKGRQGFAGGWKGTCKGVEAPRTNGDLYPSCSSFSLSEKTTPPNILQSVIPVDHELDFEHLQGVFIPLNTISSGSSGVLLDLHLI